MQENQTDYLITQDSLEAILNRVKGTLVENFVYAELESAIPESTASEIGENTSSKYQASL